MTDRLEQGRFERLVNRLIDQRLTGSESVELEQMLLDDPARQRVYLDAIEVHLAISQILRDVQASTALPCVAPARSSSRLIWYAIGSIVSLATVFLFMATMRSLLTPGRSLVDAARSGSPGASMAGEASPATYGGVILAQNSSAEFFGTMPPGLGTAIEMNRQFILTYGSIELIFPRGATVLLGAPAIFSVVSGERLFLESGQCSVYAPDGAEGFQVETPLANVVDLGTRFGVSVDDSGETNVQVIEGAAEVTEKSPEGTSSSVPMLLESHDVGMYPVDLQRPSRFAQYDPSTYRYGLRDRILKYQAAPAEDPSARGVQDLLSITVQRGGESYRYDIDEMIPSKVTHFRSTQREQVQPVAYRYGDQRPIRELLKSDNSLDTGIFNPGASKQPLTKSPDEQTVGMALRFDTPVVNSVGPDIAFFELQGYDNPKLGDAFHVSPLQFRDSLRSYTVREFDIPMTSPEALKVAGFGLLRFEHAIDSLADLHSGRYSKRYRHFNFRALAVGIDLSDLGYAENEVVEGLFIQDADDDETHNGGSMVDPVYIGGFPAIVTGPVSDAPTDPTHP